MTGPDLQLGSELAGYKLERLLGRGGMGLVYLAGDQRLGRKVALKLLAPELAEDERFRERFLRESRTAASLEHPNIVPIHAAGESEGQLYIAMRYVEGTDLRSLLAAEAPLAPERALALAAQVASALDAAHEKGLVHRDVKPANVLLAAGHAYLADFGLTKRTSSRSGLTATGELAGTVDYVAPEQIRGEPLDGRADVYSLACLLYECLTGTPPFRRESELATMWAHVHEPVPRPRSSAPELPGELDAIFARALAKSPSDRFATCGDFVAATADVLRPREQTERKRGRATRIAALATLPLLALAGLGAWLLASGDDAKPLTGLSEHSLGALDPVTNTLVGEAKVGFVPIAVAEGTRAVWVGNASDHTVTRVDPDELVAEVTVGLPGAPVALAMDGDELLAVTTHVPQRLVRVNAAGNETRVEAVLSDVPTPSNFHDSEVGRAAGSLWMDAPGVQRVAIVRLGPAGDTSRIDPGLSTGHLRGLAAGSGAVWIVSPAGDVARIDAATGRVRRFEPLEAFPGGVAVGAGAVWVTDLADDLLFRLDPRTGRPERTIAVGSSPKAVVFGFGSVWVLNSEDGTVSRVDPATNAVTATIPVGPNIESITVGRERIWLTRSAPGAFAS
jgi:YVTN family beta-propeller protein